MDPIMVHALHHQTATASVLLKKSTIQRRHSLNLNEVMAACLLKKAAYCGARLTLSHIRCRNQLLAAGLVTFAIST